MGKKSDPQGKWSPWKVGVWIVWLVVFGVWELLGLMGKVDDHPPLTQVFVRYVPFPVPFAISVWLLHHVLASYLGVPGSGWLVAGLALAVGVGIWVVTG